MTDLHFFCVSQEELDDLGGLKWSCHTSSLEAAAALYRPLLAPLTLEESSFGEGWGSFVTLLAAAWRSFLMLMWDLVILPLKGK